jgi:hypothetical protein
LFFVSHANGENWCWGADFSGFVRFEQSKTAIFSVIWIIWLVLGVENAGFVVKGARKCVADFSKWRNFMESAFPVRSMKKEVAIGAVVSHSFSVSPQGQFPRFE